MYLWQLALSIVLDTLNRSLCTVKFNFRWSFPEVWLVYFLVLMNGTTLYNTGNSLLANFAWSFLENTTPAWASISITCKLFTCLSSSCLANSNRILLGSGDALGAASCCSFAKVNFPTGVLCFICWDSLGAATASSLKHKRYFGASLMRQGGVLTAKSGWWW